jgi:hypothetical protein
MNPTPKSAPDHHDAELVLRLYELRRESVMRDARAVMNAKFWPATVDEALAVLKQDHQLNSAYRQTSTYWEMVFGMAHHGIVHADYLVENSGEGLLLFARAEPYLARLREATNPRTFRHAEWAATETGTGRAMMETLRKRVAQKRESR